MGIVLIRALLMFIALGSSRAGRCYYCSDLLKSQCERDSVCVWEGGTCDYSPLEKQNRQIWLTIKDCTQYSEDEYQCYSYDGLDDNYACVWEKNKCVRYDLRRPCEEILDIFNCRLRGGCRFNDEDESCHQLTCGDYYYEDACLGVMTDRVQAQPCRWEKFKELKEIPGIGKRNGHCVEASVQSLSFKECIRKIQRTVFFFWDGERCTNCKQTQIDSTSYTLSVIVLICILMISII